VAEGILRPGGASPRPVTRRGPTPGFSEPERVPWSELGPDFISTWGHDDAGRLKAEHLEVAGQSGSGKSYAIATILQQRAERWDSAEIAVLTKEADDSIPLLGWPEAATLRDLRQWQQCVFWPRSGAIGEARERHMEAALYDLLASLWRKDANCVVYFDEIGFVEDLSNRLKKMTRQYWREGRSHGISVIASKQRPLGINRDAHSESRWKIVFAPADEADMERFAQLLGRPADWEPVLRELDQTRHEFVIRNSFTRAAYVSWIDLDLKPVPAQTPEGQRRQPEDTYHRRRQ
jgi:hypothetical protein